MAQEVYKVMFSNAECPVALNLNAVFDIFRLADDDRLYIPDRPDAYR